MPRRAMWRFPNRADAAEIGADAAEIGADAAEIGADAAEIGADAAQIGPTRSVSAVSAESGRNSKKKKVQNAPFDLT